MTDIAPVDRDQHAERIAADVHAGRLTVDQAVRLALAVGRIQGLYASAIQIGIDSGIVSDFNKTRNGGNGNG